jgi:hypothetical protein
VIALAEFIVVAAPTGGVTRIVEFSSRELFLQKNSIRSRDTPPLFV